MPRSVALLRGINVAGNKKVPMADLRLLCAGLGWKDAETYIQSGNVVFTAAGTPGTLETKLEGAISEQFGFSVSVLVRRAADWKTFASGNPFTEAIKTQSNLVMLALAKKALNADAGDSLQTKAAAGERVQQVGQAVWIHFPRGSGTSKITPAVLDRCMGSPVTTRNWRTVEALGNMLES